MNSVLTNPIAFCILCFCVLFCNSIQGMDSAGPTLDTLLKECENRYAKISDYTCFMQRTELIGNKYKSQDGIFMKFRKPASFYLKWPDGTEVLYSEGRYAGEMMVHLGGILRFVSVAIDPKGYLAMQNNRHSICDAGIGHFMKLIRANYAKAKKNGEGAIHFSGESFLNKRAVYIYRAEFPKGKGYYAGRVVIYVDREHLLPLRTEAYDWDNRLMEQYSFTDLKINVNLGDKDFDRDNGEYGF